MVTVRPSGKPGIYWYDFSNDNGFEFIVTNYGATLTSIKTPDRNGEIDEVTLGFDDIEHYLAGHPYFGSTVGRYANRISRGTFSLNGKTYHLTQNAGQNHLHGGAEGFDKKIWTADVKGNEVSFQYTSPDGEEGYPAAVNVSVSFSITAQNEIVIRYEAVSDGDTIINLTNHAYFNLNNGADNMLDQVLEIDADQIIEADAELIATGRLLDVADTPFDFRRQHKIGDCIHDDSNDMIRSAGGYDVSYVLSHPNIEKASAKVYDPATGRCLRMFTTQPGVHFYTSQQLKGENIIGHSGKAYPPYSGFCLETHHFPDSPNHPQFPSTILKKGETFRTETKYAFDVEE